MRRKTVPIGPSLSNRCTATAAPSWIETMDTSSSPGGGTAAASAEGRPRQDLLAAAVQADVDLASDPQRPVPHRLHVRGHVRLLGAAIEPTELQRPARATQDHLGDVVGVGRVGIDPRATLEV